jgi:hypothetical protein
MVVSANSTREGLGPVQKPITNATHNDPLSHAFWSRPSSRRSADPDPPSAAASWRDPFPARFLHGMAREPLRSKKSSPTSG